VFIMDMPYFAALSICVVVVLSEKVS